MKNLIQNTKNGIIIEKLKDISAEDIIKQAVRLPLIRIDRASFLRKELIKYYPKKIVEQAIEKNPAFAGVSRECVNTIAEQVIDYETNKVTAVSFIAGVPGGAAMAATIPADIVQYFGFMLRAMQELAYLYGFGDFDLNESEISDDTLNQMLIFLGVMFGVSEANAGVKILAGTVTNKISKSLAQKALTKGMIYPIVKKIASKLGVHITKQIFADGVSKIVPFIGGAVSGTLTHVTFKLCVERLQKSFIDLPLCDPEYYRSK